MSPMRQQFLVAEQQVRGCDVGCILGCEVQEYAVCTGVRIKRGAASTLAFMALSSNSILPDLASLCLLHRAGYVAQTLGRTAAVRSG